LKTFSLSFACQAFFKIFSLLLQFMSVSDFSIKGLLQKSPKHKRGPFSLHTEDSA
jgi:hypothetical protein